MLELSLYVLVFFLGLIIATSGISRRRVIFETRLIEAQNEFYKIANELEMALLSSTFVLGDATHDILFKMTEITRNRNSYIPLRIKLAFIFGIRNPRGEKLLEAIRCELKNAPGKIRDIEQRLMKAYIELIMIKHWKFFTLLFLYYIFKSQRVTEKKELEPTAEKLAACAAA